MNNIVSFYRHFGAESEEAKLSEVLEAIKIGAYKNRIEELQKMNEEEYGKVKKSLPHFTPCGTFSGNRNLENLVNYTGIIILDIDKTGGDALKIKNSATENEYTLATFISPSGEGVKILVKTDATLDRHEEYFSSTADYFEEFLGVAIDRSGKDITRACFISYDSELYYNENPTVYSVPEFDSENWHSAVNVTTDLKDVFFNIVDFTENIDTYYDGNRNNFIYRLSNNLNRAGIEKDTAEYLIKQNFTDPEIQWEITSAVKSAYSHTEEYGKFGYGYYQSVCSAGFASFATVAKREETPVVPEDVYERLPDFLKKCTSVFAVAREKDMFLTGALSNLSGCFNNVEGKYDKRIFSANLFSFVISIPGSGKGVINYVRQLLYEIHKIISTQTDENAFVYETRKNRGKSLFIPADSSSAAIKKTLVANNEQGVMCETEADTLSATLAQDWGGFDDLLRKSFQHEPITFSRIDKDSNEAVIHEINRPKLSVCLTGTPSQVPTLLKSTENGLFSRFIFYTFKNNHNPVFKDVFSDEDDEMSLDEFFAEKAQQLYEMWLKTKNVGKSTFTLTKEQKVIFHETFKKMLAEMQFRNGEEINGIVFRLGLITFRIAMLLTIIRTLENNTFSYKIECCDDDFNTSMVLSEIYLQHSMAVFQTLPQTRQAKQNAMTLLNYLPEKFKLTDAILIGASYCSQSPRSVSNYLKELVGKELLNQPKQNGPYYRTSLQ